MDGTKCLSYTLKGVRYVPNRFLPVDEKDIAEYRAAGVFFIEQKRAEAKEKPVEEKPVEEKPVEEKPAEKSAKGGKPGKPKGVISSGDLKK